MSFNPAASNFSTASFIPDRNTYQFLVSGISARKVTTKDGPRGIVNFNLRMESDPYKGKPLTLSCFVGALDSEDNLIPETADTLTLMQVVLACFGINPGAQGDEQFKAQYNGIDLDVDFKNGTAKGDDWRQIIGRSFVADTGQRVDKNDASKIYPTFNLIRPVTS